MNLATYLNMEVIPLADRQPPCEKRQKAGSVAQI